MSPIVIAIPTYNERENIVTIVGRLHKAIPWIDIVIVDDNSPDGTGDIAQQLADESDNIYVIHRRQKEGLGPAYIQAFTWAKQRGYTWVGEMDADGSHRPEQLKRLISAAIGPDNPDLVIGSRWVRGGAVNGWAANREALSRLGNAYIGVMLGLGVADATAGYRLYRTSLFNRLNLNDVECYGYSFQVDMTRLAVKVGAHIVEVPITFDERQRGVSKMSGNIIVEALKQVTTWGIKDRVAQIMSKLGLK